MDSSLSEITKIRHESARYEEKALFVWNAMHALGVGTKCWCAPEVRYLWSGSE